MRVEVDAEMVVRLQEHKDECAMCKALGHSECPGYEQLVEFHLLIVTTRHEVETTCSCTTDRSVL